MENENPIVYESAMPRLFRPDDELNDVHDDIDSREIFVNCTWSIKVDDMLDRLDNDEQEVEEASEAEKAYWKKNQHLIRDINDPEHPLTLEQLNVVQQGHIEIDDQKNRVMVYFTPTIPHCSMATLIGLSLKVRLLRSLPERFKIDVKILPGTHSSEHAVNKQLADKERVAAALENAHLLDVVNQCLTFAQ